jgi:hypothetical protein
MIWVNSKNVRHLPTPFGGVKGLRHRTRWRRLVVRYTETKNIAFATGKHAIQKLGGYPRRADTGLYRGVRNRTKPIGGCALLILMLASRKILPTAGGSTCNPGAVSLELE